MSQVAALRTEAAGSRTAAGWWPVDVLILAYLGALGLVIACFQARIPGAGWLMAFHLAGALLIVLAVKCDNLGPVSLIWLFRHWYPLPYLAACYRELSIVIPAVRGVSFDAQLARLDFLLWGVHPTVWLERYQTPWLTEVLQLIYAVYLVPVLLVSAILWRRRQFEEFRRYAFLVSLGYVLSYVGYLLVPARGPRFLLHDLQATELHGLWSFSTVRRLLDVAESIHYDCFPSAHTELTLLACWAGRWLSPNLFRAFSAYAVLMLFSTVYLRYHYTIDLAAGAVAALLLVGMSPRLTADCGEAAE